MNLRTKPYGMKLHTIPAGWKRRMTSAETQVLVENMPTLEITPELKILRNKKLTKSSMSRLKRDRSFTQLFQLLRLRGVRAVSEDLAYFLREHQVHQLTLMLAGQFPFWISSIEPQNPETTQGSKQSLRCQLSASVSPATTVPQV